MDQVGWLSDQPPELRQWAGEFGRWRSYAAGTFVYHAGDQADGIYGLGEGSLQVDFPLVAGEPVSIYRAEIGFWIGDAALLAEVPRIVSVVAATESRLFFLPGAAVLKLLAKHPEYWRSFYRLSAANQAMSVTMLSETLALTVRARVCRRLLSLAKDSGEAQITQDRLASVLGVARPTLRRCLVDLAERGGIELHYGKLGVVDRAVLEQFREEQ